jgi:tRNA dimethylallyltransferase
VTAGPPRLLVVCGPTATGKTAFAIGIAEETAGEIVSADSMQVYRRMDIGTAKPTAAERERAAFHLLDVADPDDTFSTGRFQTLAAQAIDEILARDRTPIVAGGTGLYIKALTRGLWRGPSADPRLRQAYKAAEAAEPGSLHRRLRAVDPERAAEVHPADFVRLERALEVYDLTGRPISEWQKAHGFNETPYRVCKIGLSLPREELTAATDRRVLAMMENGWLDEVKQLRGLNYGPELPSQAALGYRELHRHLDGQTTYAEAVERTQTATRQFAKRQRTWFGGDAEIEWFDAHRELDAARARSLAFLRDR